MRQILLSGVISLFIVCSFALNNPYGEDVSKIEPYAFENLINQTIEGLRENISDPLIIDSLEITSPVDLLNGTLKISNFNLAGLKGFQVTALNLALIGMRLNFTVDFPTINLSTGYWLDFLIADLIALYGEGTIKVDIDHLEIQGSTQADLTNGIQVKNLRIQLYVNNITFEIHGLLNDEDLSSLLSEILNDLTTKFIDENQELVTQILSPILEDLINSILSNGGDTTVAPVSTAAIPHK